MTANAHRFAVDDSGAVDSSASRVMSAEDNADNPDADVPFGRPLTSRQRAVWVGTGVVVFGISVAIAIFASRREDVAVAPVHNHGASVTSASASPVMIDAEAARRIGVTYARVVMAPLPREVRSVGEVTFDETRLKTVSPRIDGWIEQLYVNFTGQFVRRGDPLFSIYSPMLVTAQEELLLARRLASDVAQGTPEAARGAADLVAAARRRLLYWDVPESDVARLEQTGEVQRTVTLRAPADGYVVEKPVLAGQQIMAGVAAYKIADLGVVWIEGDVFEQDIEVVRAGARVAVDIQAYPGEQFNGRVAFVNPMLNEASRTLRVRVELANPGLLLKPGMYATIRLTGGNATPVLSVPRTAVLETGSRAVVFVRRPDGMLEPRVVVAGPASDDRIRIVSGLAAGDTVVASATFLIDAESNLKAALDAMSGMPGTGTSKRDSSTDPHDGHTR